MIRASIKSAERICKGLLLALLILVTMQVCESAANQAGKTIWHTGSELTKKLQSTGSVAWSNVPLKTALSNFSTANRICIVLDRQLILINRSS